MTVRNLLKLTTCAFQLRSGNSRIYALVKPSNVRKHLDEEVTQICARKDLLIIYSSVPDYEIDVDVNVEVDPDLDIVDLPWE